MKTLLTIFNTILCVAGTDKSASGVSAFRRICIIFALASFPAGSAVGDILTTETIGGVEVEIRRAGDGIYPLVIFSHGMGGCPSNNDEIQSRLADAGYIVVAPKHEDCFSGSTTPDVPWADPENWTDQTNRDRRDDIHAVLDALPFSSYAQYVQDFGQIGCMGYSQRDPRSGSSLTVAQTLSSSAAGRPYDKRPDAIPRRYAGYRNHTPVDRVWRNL